jgi:hypothetical protein
MGRLQKCRRGATEPSLCVADLRPTRSRSFVRLRFPLLQLGNQAVDPAQVDGRAAILSRTCCR